MSLKQIGLSFFAILLLAQASYGQYQRPRYQPSRPTVSPYLYLSQPETNGMPSYYAFVRPYQRQSQVNQSQQGQLQTQQTEIKSLDNQFQLRQTATPPTGSNSTFMNYSHYFPSAGGNSAKQRK